MASKKMTYDMAEKMESPADKKKEMAGAEKKMHKMPNGKMMPGKKHKKK